MVKEIYAKTKNEINGPNCFDLAHVDPVTQDDVNGLIDSDLVELNTYNFVFDKLLYEGLCARNPANHQEV